MTPRQMELVQETMKRVLAQNGAFTELFYGRLFALDPALRFLFDPHMEKQQKLLVAALERLVRDLGRPERLTPALRYLGQQHAYYGVRPTDYELVQEALLVALEEVLGEAFTEEAREAWIAACRMMSRTMKAAAEQAESPLGF